MTTTPLSPQDLFQLQRSLDNLEWAAREDNRKDFQRSMDITRLQNEVREGQEALGGQVFRIPAERIPALAEKIAKLSKRYDKLGLDSGAPTMTDTGERENEKYRGAIHEWAYVLVSGHPPRLHGWTFVATLQHEEAGTILRSVPGFDLDLGDYRNALPECQHCGYRRHRKDTYVVFNEDTEGYRQVGRNCLADFIGGLSPERAAKGFEFYWNAMDEAGRYQSEGFTGFRPDPTWDTEELLAHTAWSIRNRGWVSKGTAYNNPEKLATATDATNNLYNLTYQVRDKKTHAPLWEVPSDEDFEVGKATVEFVRNEMTGDSDYVHNLKVAIAADATKTRNSGIACSAVFCYLREQDNLRKQEAAKVANAHKTNEHFGIVVPKGQGKADRHTLTLTVQDGIKVHTSIGAFGEEITKFITTLEDADGRTFKWFGSYRLDEGTTYVGKWSIKAHDEWQGTKQTVITRPAKLEEVSA